jgi:hypothetical protein
VNSVNSKQQQGEPKDQEGSKDTEGNVNTQEGNVPSRDGVANIGGRGLAIGGDVSGSTIVTGDHNVVNAQQLEHRQVLLANLDQLIDATAGLVAEQKEDLRGEIQEIVAADERNEQDEGFFARRLRNIKRMSPDILEVALVCILDPMAGFGAALKKVAERMRKEQEEY